MELNCSLNFYCRSSVVPILIHTSVFHAPFYISSIHFNFILPSTSGSSKWAVSALMRNSVCTSPLPYTFRIPCPCHSAVFSCHICYCILFYKITYSIFTKSWDTLRQTIICYTLDQWFAYCPSSLTPVTVTFGKQYLFSPFTWKGWAESVLIRLSGYKEPLCVTCLTETTDEDLPLVPRPAPSTYDKGNV
jgi:hypothetical protein